MPTGVTGNSKSPLKGQSRRSVLLTLAQERTKLLFHFTTNSCANEEEWFLGWRSWRLLQPVQHSPSVSDHRAADWPLPLPELTDSPLPPDLPLPSAQLLPESLAAAIFLGITTAALQHPQIPPRPPESPVMSRKEPTPASEHLVSDPASPARFLRSRFSAATSSAREDRQAVCQTHVPRRDIRPAVRWISRSPREDLRAVRQSRIPEGDVRQSHVLQRDVHPAIHLTSRSLREDLRTVRQSCVSREDAIRAVRPSCVHPPDTIQPEDATQANLQGRTHGDSGPPFVGPLHLRFLGFFHGVWNPPLRGGPVMILHSGPVTASSPSLSALAFP